MRYPISGNRGFGELEFWGERGKSIGSTTVSQGIVIQSVAVRDYRGGDVDIVYAPRSPTAGLGGYDGTGNGDIFLK